MCWCRGCRRNFWEICGACRGLTSSRASSRGLLSELLLEGLLLSPKLCVLLLEDGSLLGFDLLGLLWRVLPAGHASLELSHHLLLLLLEDLLLLLHLLLVLLYLLLTHLLLVSDLLLRGEAVVVLLLTLLVLELRCSLFLLRLTLLLCRKDCLSIYNRGSTPISGNRRKFRKAPGDRSCPIVSCHILLNYGSGVYGEVLGSWLARRSGLS